VGYGIRLLQRRMSQRCAFRARLPWMWRRVFVVRGLDLLPAGVMHHMALPCLIRTVRLPSVMRVPCSIWDCL
jgi:hypothetical protein